MSGILFPTLIIIGILPVFLQVSYERGKFSFHSRLLFVPLYRRGEEYRSSRGKNGASRLRECVSGENGKIYLKTAYTTLKRLVPHIKIPYLKLHILAAGDDPANVAMAYGAVGTALEKLRTLVSNRVRVMDLRADLDFQRDRPEIEASVRFGLPLYQAMWFGLSFFWDVWREHRLLHKRSMSTHDESTTR